MTITPTQLKEARTRLDWSQDDVASVVGVNVLTIVNFEFGKTTLNRDVLNDIRIALEAAGADLSNINSKAATTQQGRPIIHDEAAIPPIPHEPYDGSPL